MFQRKVFGPVFFFAKVCRCTRILSLTSIQVWHELKWTSGEGRGKWETSQTSYIVRTCTSQTPKDCPDGWPDPSWQSGRKWRHPWLHVWTEWTWCEIEIRGPLFFPFGVHKNFSQKSGKSGIHIHKETHISHDGWAGGEKATLAPSRPSYESVIYLQSLRPSSALVLLGMSEFRRRGIHIFFANIWVWGPVWLIFFWSNQ